MERLSVGFSSKLGSFEMQARWITACAPRTLFLTATGSRTSPFTSSSLVCGGSTSSPKRKRSITRTRCPWARSLGTSTAPTYPPPPVTSTVFPSLAISGSPRHGLSLDVDRPPHPGDGPERFQDVRDRHGLRSAMGPLHVGESHLDRAMTRVQRMDEHLGEEIEPALRLWKRAGKCDRVNARPLVVVHLEPEQPLHP